jgi:hypothetical protein
LLLDSTVLSLRHCRCHMVAVACPRHPCRGSRRRRRNPTSRGGSETAALGGGSSAIPPLPPTSAARLCHLRPLGSGLTRAERCPVALPPCVLKILHPCNPNPVCRYISSATLLRAGAAAERPISKNLNLWYASDRYIPGIGLKHFRCHVSGIYLVYTTHVTHSHLRFIYQEQTCHMTCCHIPDI